MTNRRKFIKNVAAAGIASSMPTFILSRDRSDQRIQLLVRADDMANNWCRTLGMVKSFKKGIVTSVSLMTPSPYYEESVRLCKENPSMTVGLHLTLLATRTRPVLSPEVVSSIITPTGFFHESIDELNNGNPKAEEMEKEIRAQIGKARASGLHFVYLDWHRAVPDEVREIIFRICQEQKLIFGQARDGSIYGYERIPFIPENFPSQILPDGSRAYYAGPALTREEQELAYERLENLKPGKWAVVVHPGIAEPNRASVTELLCSERTKEIIRRKNIQLVSYYDIWKQEFVN